MPYLTRLLVRASLVNLGLGFTFGALILSEKGVSYAPWLLRFLPFHIELLLFGWTVQMVMGIVQFRQPGWIGLRQTHTALRCHGSLITLCDHCGKRKDIPRQTLAVRKSGGFCFPFGWIQ